jgi:hypothetical protein
MDQASRPVATGQQVMLPAPSGVDDTTAINATAAQTVPTAPMTSQAEAAAYGL